MSSQPVTPDTQLAAVTDLAVVAASTPAADSLAVPTVAADSAGSAVTSQAGSTDVDAADAQPGTLTISDSAPTGGQSAIAADGSPSATAATQQTTTGATPPAGAPAGDSGSTPVAPQSTSLSITSAQTATSPDTGTLGARGPPNTYGPVLIQAATGGSVSAGDATLTFAPGSLPHDAYVSVTVTAAPADGLVDYSAAYNLTAVNTATGDLIEQFASPPQLTIDVGATGGPAPTIYYLAPTGDPVQISSSFDAATGTVSAGLPHFSTYVAGSGVQDFVAWVESELGQYASSALAGTQTISPATTCGSAASSS